MNNTYMSNEDVCRFKSIMVRAGFNIESLSNVLGMSRATLSSRVNGKTDFNRSEMERIAELFNQPPEYIFFAA